ncbi:MAG: hypothetical protein MUO40_11020, partial [Anaerolineaceae bacterium]|nr:hypothetical protein [Anaerolineaceae bacterium]
TINQAELIVNSLNGIIIPAHVNREAYGLLSHLGFVPPELKLTTLEISRHISAEDSKLKFPQIKDYHLIQSGDVHFIDDFLGVNYFEIEQPSIKELTFAFAGMNSRKHIINNTCSDKSHSKI